VGDTPILIDPVSEAERILAAAHADRVVVRVTGGVAVALHAPAMPDALKRPYQDIDLVCRFADAGKAAALLTKLGYEANERFNKMNAATRMVFYDNEHGKQIDVFVGEFVMCHRIPIAGRLDVDDRTVPLAELLLTKLQVVRLNPKDLKDIWAIMVDHDTADHDNDAINIDFVAHLLARDWGLWRTSQGTIELARSRLPSSGLEPSQQATIDARLGRLWSRVEEEPKTLRWRARARLGEHAQWFQEPEEIAHAETLTHEETS